MNWLSDYSIGRFVWRYWGRSWWLFFRTTAKTEICFGRVERRTTVYRAIHEYFYWETSAGADLLFPLVGSYGCQPRLSYAADALYGHVNRQLKNRTTFEPLELRFVPMNELGNPYDDAT